MADNTGTRIYDREDWEEPLQAWGSLLFGAIGYALLFAIPHLFHSAILEYMDSGVATFLLFTGVLLLTVGFLYFSNVKSSVFLVFAIIGVFVSYILILTFYGPSPVFEVLFFAFIGILIIGTVIRIGLLRSWLSL